MAKRQQKTGARTRTNVRAGKGAGDSSAALKARQRFEAEPDLPRWVAPVVFAVLTVLLFPEVFFKHNTLFGHDTLGLSYLARDFYTEFVRTHHAFPLWDPMVLGGLPFLEGMHGDIFYPPSLALFFLHAKDMWAWKMVLHIFLAGIFAYIWLRRGMKLRRGPALFGGVVFMMGADLVSLVAPGGDGKLFVSALAPLVFWLAERAAVGRRIADFAAFALGITLIILTSHMQLAYFCIWGVTFYFFFRVWSIWRDSRNGREAARLIGMFALAGVLGLGAAAIQFLPPLQYVKATSQRADVRNSPEATYEEATSYAMHPEELMSLVVPEFVGATDMGIKDQQNAPPTYWGRNPFKLNHEYAGVIALLLLPIMFLRRRRREVWFFTGLGIFSLLFAAGDTTPLFHLFIHIPGVKLFRAPSLIIFLYALSISTLGAMAVQRLLEWRGGDDADTRAATRYLWIALGVTGFLAVLATSGVLMTIWRRAIYDPAAFDDFKAASLVANIGRMQVGFWILFALTAMVAAWWAGMRKATISATAAVALITVLGAADLYRVDRPFVKHTADYNEAIKTWPFFTSDSVLAYLQKQAADPKHVFRVANFHTGGGDYAYRFSRNTLAIHGIQQVAGLHGNEIGRYVNVVGTDATGAFNRLGLLNLVNAEYVLFPGEIQDIAQFQLVSKQPGAALYRNTTVFPRAFLVGSAQVVRDSIALDVMRNASVDFHRVAIVSEKADELDALEGDVSGSVEWLEYSPNRLRMRVTSNKPALMVVSDNYYDAWKATVAGKPARILRTDYTFRGVVVPAGTTEVEMYYSTDHLRVAAFTSIILMLLLIGACIGGIIRRPEAE
jgi:hypothetical protein